MPCKEPYAAFLIDEKNRGKQELFETWIRAGARGVKPLFFAGAATEFAIEQRLRSLLQSTIERSQDLNKPEVTVGRIIIHGSIPHLVWSRSEAYRPIYFFFGNLDDRCKKCKPLSNSRASAGSEYDDDARAIVSPMWQSKALNWLDNGGRPRCWSELFLVLPDLPLGQPHYKCQALERENSKWTVRDILALSRLRLRRWAIRKREILGTPGASVRDDRRRLELLGGIDLMRNQGNERNIVSVADQAHYHSTKKSSREQYVLTFSSDAWERAFVWEKLKRTSIFKAKYKTDDMEDIEFGSREAQKILRAQDAWQDEEENWSSGSNNYHWLNTELCALSVKDIKRTILAMYGCRSFDDHLLIYFELETEDSQFDPFRAERRSIAIDDQDLFDFCHEVLLPWLKVFREADNRWENGQTFRSLFPDDMRFQLLGSLEEVERQIEATSTESSQDRLRRVECFYKRRVHKEEDEPVQLALSAMSDIWKFAFGDVLSPHYFEFQRFQQLLKDIPDYRDHLTHSIEVFLLGSQLLDKILKENRSTSWARFDKRFTKWNLADIPAFCKGQSKNDKLDLLEERILRFQWALAALIHDFAIPVEKTNQLVNHMFETFLGVKSDGKVGSDGLKQILAQEQSAYRAFLYTLISNTQTGAEVIGQRSPLPLLSEFAYQRLAEDHGFLSAIYLFNQLFEKTRTEGRVWWRLRKDVQESILSHIFDREVAGSSTLHTRFAEVLVLEVLDAIVKHNAFAKEHMLCFEGGPSYKFPAEFFSASAGIFGSAVPGLLMLCDTLCDWGRVIHPDELRRHEVGHTHKGKQPEIVRPECRVTKVEHKDSMTTITAKYKWRLPYVCNVSERMECLKRGIYPFLRREMWPYSPGFTMWEGCRTCSNDKQDPDGRIFDTKKCNACVTLNRFWSQVVAAETSNDGWVTNRLRFPEQNDLFNNISVRLEFYDHPLCNFHLGTGVKRPGNSTPVLGS